ncbi:MAG: AAA family ATPase, partial [Pseudomonadales bacterium]
VIVMTSNLGSDVIQTMSGEENYEQMRKSVMEIVGTHFRPEFINRVDEVVVFHPLARDQIASIALVQLEFLKKRLSERELSLELSAEAVELLAETGFDPVYGARPLKRAIQTHLENPLAQQVLQGVFMPGDVIKADVVDGEIIFST